MTKMLASVTGTEEAETAIECNVDIIDLKDPKAGALGALPTAGIRALVAAINFATVLLRIATGFRS